MKIYLSTSGGQFASLHCLTRQTWEAGRVYREGQEQAEPHEQETRIFLRRERVGGEEVEYYHPLDLSEERMV